MYTQRRIENMKEKILEVLKDETKGQSINEINNKLHLTDLNGVNELENTLHELVS